MLPSCTIHFELLNRPAWKPKEPVPPCGSPAPLFALLHRERIPTGPVLHSSLRREGPEENLLPGKGVFRSSMPSAVFPFRSPCREIPGSDSCHLPDSAVLPLQKKPLGLTSGSKMTCPKRVAQSSISTNFCRARMPTYSQPCTPAVTTSVFPGCAPHSSHASSGAPPGTGSFTCRFSPGAISKPHSVMPIPPYQRRQWIPAVYGHTHPSFHRCALPAGSLLPGPDTKTTHHHKDR